MIVAKETGFRKCQHLKFGKNKADNMQNILLKRSLSKHFLRGQRAVCFR